MDRKCKVIIRKLSFPLDGCLNYDVQLWYDFKDTFVYAGNGKYFKTPEESERFAAEHATAGIERNF